MSNEGFLRVLEDVQKSIDKIMGKYQDTKRWKSLNEVMEAIEFFRVRITKDGSLDIYYDNEIFSVVGYFKPEEQKIVAPLMSLYTNISYYVLKAKSHVTKRTYEKLCVEKQKMGVAIREICVQDFTDCVITKEKVKYVKSFLEWAIPQLYHCVEENEERYSERFELEDARKLKKIREVYKSFRVGRKYVYYYDEIISKNKKIPIDSPEVAYAISMLFCESYAVSVNWLNKNAETGYWEFYVPEKIISRFQYLLSIIYH